MILAVASDAPPRVSSLLFLDFTESLRLGEQTGTWSSGSGDEPNAEINLSIP